MSASASAAEPTDLDRFAAGVRHFLDANADRRAADTEGIADTEDADDPTDLVPVFSYDGAGADPAADLVAARRWQRCLDEHGYAWIDGPTRFGGSGLSAAHAACFDSVAAGYRIPDQDMFLMGRRVLGPVLLDVADEQVRARYLPGLYRGETVACQLFSEPGAGSDLAALRTRAVRTDDGWLVDGSKVWTSQAHLADVGLLLARTEPGLSGRDGLTVFLLDVHAPGVTVRPLRQMNGEAHFNEVQLSAVPVPDRDRIGDAGAGWPIAKGALRRERAAVATRARADRYLLQRLLDLVAASDGAAAPDGVLRDLVGRAAVSAHALEWTSRRLRAEQDAGVAGSMHRASLVKLARNRFLRDLLDAAAGALGEAAICDTGEWGTFAWARAALTVPGQRIAGGTDEIQRTTLAERVLGLPSERVRPRAG